MQNKKTVLFFTDRYRTEVAENILNEYADNGSVLGLIVTRKEVSNPIVNATIDKLLPDDSGFRYALRNKRLLFASLKSKRIPSQNTTFSKRDRRQARILNAINRYNPDVVAVTTHTLLADVLAAVEKYGQSVKVVVIAEEFVLDKRLIQRNVDYYFVDNYDMRTVLSEGGIPDDRIEIASLPIAKEYFENNDREKALKKFALEGDRPVVLVSSSAVGDSRFKKVLEAIKNADLNADFIIACGKNRPLLTAARELGFSSYNEGIDMNAALNACDLLISRPTTMLMGAAIVKNKPVYALLPNGKTEEANLDYLALDAVTKIKDLPDLIFKTEQFLNGLNAPSLDSPEAEENSNAAEQPAKKTTVIEDTSAKRIAKKLLEMASEKSENQ